MSSVEVHRPGIFKQRNKTHKTGRHRSKGIIAKEIKGKTESAVIVPRKRKASLERHDKKNQHIQAKKRKMEETLVMKRSRGVMGSPPFLVVVLPSSQSYNLLDEFTNAMGDCEDVTITKSERSCVVICDRFKQRFEFIQPATLEGYLNAAKLADCLLIGVDLSSIEEDEVIDEFSNDCITCLYHQGLSSVVLTCQGIKSVPIKKQSDTKKFVLSVFQERFQDLKIHALDSNQDAIGVLRTIGSQKNFQLNYRECRPNLFASRVNLITADDGSESTLALTGYLRGESLSANQLIHIPGYGNFQINTITGPNDPYPIIKNSKKQRLELDCEMEPENVLQRSDPDKQEGLEMEQEVDPMAEEQTWPTEEELAEAAQRLTMKRTMKKVVPKGFSEYQAAWLNDDDDDDDDEEDDYDDGDEEEEEDDNMEYDEEDEKESLDDTAESRMGENFEMDTMSVADGDAAYDAKFDEDEEKEALKRYKEARSQEMFPDEVDTPNDIEARVRFEKYRGLKSFRTSPWDVNEDLPADYERIIRFKDFKVMKKRIMQQMKEEKKTESKVESGTYVTITASVKDPSRLEDLVASPEPIVAFGLMPFEQKLTVMHFLIRRCHGDDDIIKSKEPMIFYVGCHRFKSFPIYSQHTKGPLHKFEKFFSPESSMVASVYAPMIFPPASVLMFKPTKTGEKLVGTGTLLSADPDRRIIKRIILSGHPYKINKRSAVIRYMFFNREDVEYYKPIELRTKSGYRGHIAGPIGTHGHMKCIFDHQLNSQDVVLMNLYKRVYPKWTDFNVAQS